MMRLAIRNAMPPTPSQPIASDQSEPLSESLAEPRIDSWSVVWGLLMVIALPALLYGFFDNDLIRPAPIRRQNICLGASIILVIASLIALFGPASIRPRVRTFPTLVAGGCILLIGLIVWNKLFIANYVATRFGSDIFRPVNHNTHSPLYGRDARIQLAWVAIPVAIAAMLFIALIFRLNRLLHSRFTGFILVGFYILFCFTLAFPDGLEWKFERYTIRRPDAARFEGVRDLLANYVEKMPILEVPGRHYPPGLVVIYEIEDTLGLPWIAKTLGLLLPAVTILLAGKLALQVGLSRPAANLAMLLLAVSASYLIFPR